MSNGPHEVFTVTKSVTAENQYSDWLWVPKGTFQWTTGGSGWVATAILQRAALGDYSDVITIDSSTTVGSWPKVDGAGAYYRMGVATGSFTSGTLALRLARGQGLSIG